MKRFRIKETGVEVEINHLLCITKYGSHLGKDVITALGLTLEPIEPEVKKLYAYRNGDTNVQFFTEEVPNITNRAPEYDIVYEEKK